MKNSFSAVSLVVAMMALGSSAVTLTQTADRGSPQSTGLPTPVTADYEARIASLQRDLKKQQADFESSQEVFRTLMQTGALGRVWSVDLDPSTKHYDRVDSTNGFLLVACNDVQPYLDGQRVSLRIGNPLAVRFSGFKVTAGWGPRYSGAFGDAAAYGKWAAGLRKKEYSFPDSLEAGTWNEITLVLPQTRADEVGCIRVSVATDVVSLIAPRQR